jgi:hypothetical protein
MGEFAKHGGMKEWPTVYQRPLRRVGNWAENIFRINDLIGKVVVDNRLA